MADSSYMRSGVESATSAKSSREIVMSAPFRFLPFIALVGALGAIPASRAQDALALKAFETVRSVLQHPRCQNCHIPGDAPLQFDEGQTHSMSVMRGPDGRGAIAMNCSACHGESNLPPSYGPHVPPGAPNWHLPPPDKKMVFINISPAALCARIKDKTFTGGKDLEAMLVHLREDKLVAWGWNPGQGRTMPPVSREQLVDAFQQWMNLGAPCPAV
jgi:hypothetical protein